MRPLQPKTIKSDKCIQNYHSHNILVNLYNPQLEYVSHDHNKTVTVLQVNIQHEVKQTNEVIRKVIFLKPITSQKDTKLSKLY